MPSPVFAAPGPRAGRGGALALAALLAAAAACDAPSSPKWDVRFRIPADTIRQTPVEQVLPADVRTSADGSAFEVGLQTTTFSRSLGELCPLCPATPVTVQYPGFVGTLSGGIDLPSDVIAVTLLSGRIEVAVTNGLSFDPLRPPGAAGPGYVVFTARSGAAVLASDSVDTRQGASVALPPNGTLRRVLAVQGATLSQSIVVEVKIGSPAGGAVTVDRSQRISVVATGSEVRVSEAAVRVTDRAVDREQITVDLSDIDESVRNRVQGGEFLLEIANPFNVEGPFDVRIGAPGVPVINRRVQIPPGPGTDTVRVPLSRDELRGIIGQETVVVEAVGTLSSSSAPGYAVVRPRQLFVVTGYFDIILRLPED